MLFEGQLDDDSYQINMSAPCKCVAYKCGGNIVSRKTLRKHAELDYQKLNSTHHARDESALDTPRLTTPALPEIAYKTSAVFNTPLYEGARLTVGEYIFLEFRKFRDEFLRGAGGWSLHWRPTVTPLYG